MKDNNHNVGDLNFYYTPEQREQRLTGLSCPLCGGDTKYVVDGEYECVVCGETLYDDYGIVKKYIMDNGVSTVSEVVKGTGVSASSVLNLLRYGKLQLRESPGMYLKCEVCGTNIINGMVCPNCHSRIDKHSQKYVDRLRLYNMGDLPKDKTQRVVEKRSFKMNPHINDDDYKGMTKLETKNNDTESKLVTDLYEKKRKELKDKSELRWHKDQK